MTSARLPTVYIPHGGGPWPFVEMSFGDAAEKAALQTYIESLSGLPALRGLSKPKALVVISAHWEEAVPTVMTSAHPPMLYDYYGFPPAAYELTWPAPGERALAARVRELLSGAGFESKADAERGFDHGTFVPMKLAYPNADVPTVQLSLIAGLDPQKHIAMGRALAPLRDEGVFIIGSGSSYHNLRAFNRSASGVAAEFDTWLRDVATRDPKERDAQLARWASAPSARAAHPREEHLLPLMVVAGAAGSDRGIAAYGGTIMGLRFSAFHYSDH